MGADVRAFVRHAVALLSLHKPLFEGGGRLVCSCNATQLTHLLECELHPAPRVLDEDLVDEVVVHLLALLHGEALHPRQPRDDLNAHTHTATGGGGGIYTYSTGNLRYFIENDDLRSARVPLFSHVPRKHLAKSRGDCEFVLARI